MFDLGANPRRVKYEPKLVIVAANEVHGRHYARAHGISQMRAVIVTPSNVNHRLRGLRYIEVVYAEGWNHEHDTWPTKAHDALLHQLAMIELTTPAGS